MQGYRALTLATVIAVAVLHTAAASGQSVKTHSYVVKGNVVGGFPTKTGGYAQAIRVFGGPVSSTTSKSTCTLRWADGLVLVFSRRHPQTKLERSCVIFGSATITRRIWRTDRGLRVGQAAAEVQRRYPDATRTVVGGATKWRLVPGLAPALDAWVRGGKIVRLQVVPVRS